MNCFVISAYALPTKEVLLSIKEQEQVIEGPKKQQEFHLSSF